MDFNSSWNTFFGVLLAVLLIWAVLEALAWGIPLLIKSLNRRNRFIRYFSFFKKIALLLAVLVLLVTLVSINFILHGSILVLCVLFGYQYIRNFISGLILRLNPLINLGGRMKIHQFEGELVKFLPFGLILVDNKKERFIRYLDVEKMGFETINKDEGSLRNSLLIQSEISMQNTLDVVYSTPLISMATRPQITTTETPNIFLLRYTLEPGVRAENFIAYLHSNNILTPKN